MHLKLIAVLAVAAALVLPSSAGANRIVLAGSPRPTHCTAYLFGHVAQVTFFSLNLKVGPECSAWQRVNAAAGEYWVVVYKYALVPAPTDIQTACQLGSGRVTALVNDDGGMVYGQSACASLLAAGWHQRWNTERWK
jgi:hypothetical protein